MPKPLPSPDACVEAVVVEALACLAAHAYLHWRDHWLDTKTFTGAVQLAEDSARRVSALAKLGLSGKIWTPTSGTTVRPAYVAIEPTAGLEAAIKDAARAASISRRAYEAIRDRLQAFRAVAGQPGLTYSVVQTEYAVHELARAEKELLKAEARFKACQARGVKTADPVMFEALKTARAEAAASAAAHRAKCPINATPCGDLGMRVPPNYPGAQARNAAIGVAQYVADAFYREVQALKVPGWMPVISCEAAGPCALGRPVDPLGRDRGTAVRCMSKGGRTHYAHAQCFNPPVSTGAVHRANAWVCSICNEGIAQSRCIPVGVSHPQQHR